MYNKLLSRFNSIPRRGSPFLLPTSDPLFFFRHVIIPVRENRVIGLVLIGHGQRKRRQSLLGELVIARHVFSQKLSNQIRFVKLGIGVSVAKPPFRVKLLHQVKSPYEILLGSPAPNGDRVVLVCEFVEKLIRLLVIRVQDTLGRAKHLHSLQENFADVFVHHILGNLPLNERKDEEVHITLVIVIIL